MGRVTKKWRDAVAAAKKTDAAGKRREKKLHGLRGDLLDAVEEKLERLTLLDQQELLREVIDGARLLLDNVERAIEDARPKPEPKGARKTLTKAARARLDAIVDEHKERWWVVTKDATGDVVEEIGPFTKRKAENVHDGVLVSIDLNEYTATVEGRS